ncbi:MAG: FxDxF family PEP-CTERM protein [Thiobacillaceae bacterium]|jgi:hypothetical protein|nr:FxDxF family PEP-CTERM protein [Thiobacillaceae bacterium]
MKLKLNALALAAGLVVAGPALAYDPVLEWTGSMTSDFESLSMNFTITDDSLPHVASLVDTGFLAPFDFLALGVFKTGGALMGSVVGSGSVTFDPPTAGSYTAIVFGEPGAFNGFTFSTFGVTVTPVPEPETWAMLLAGLGLVGMQLRRKLKSAEKVTIN